MLHEDTVTRSRRSGSRGSAVSSGRESAGSWLAGSGARPTRCRLASGGLANRVQSGDDPEVQFGADTPLEVYAQTTPESSWSPPKRFGAETPLEDYAQALASDDPKVRDKAWRAFREHRWQIAVPAAKRFCRSLYHRNAPCPGQDCDGPFSLFWALLINECVGTEDKKAVPELVKWWNGKKRLSFEAWVQRIWRQEDALRQWNSVRGLNQRPSPPAGFAERAPAHYYVLVTVALAEVQARINKSNDSADRALYDEVEQLDERGDWPEDTADNLHAQLAARAHPDEHAEIEHDDDDDRQPKPESTPSVVWQWHLAHCGLDGLCKKPESTHSVVWQWVVALFWDACQTAYEDIDIPRVARHLWKRLDRVKEEGPDPSQSFVAAVAVLAERVDGLLAAGWKDFYDKYIGNPRTHTRQGVPLAENVDDAEGPIRQAGTSRIAPGELGADRARSAEDEYLAAAEEEETDR